MIKEIKKKRFDKCMKISQKCRIRPTTDELNQIFNLSEGLQNKFPQVYVFLNKYQDYPALAIINTLKTLKGIIKEVNYWAYGTAVIENECKKVWTDVHVKEHEQIKSEEKAGLKQFKSVLRGILEI